MTFAEALQKQMVKAGVKNQSDLAKLSGVPQPTISKYLLGMREPGRKIVLKLAAALGVTAAELLGEKKPLAARPPQPKLELAPAPGFFSVRLVGSVGAGTGMDIEASDGERFTLGDQFPKGCVAYRVSGDSMVCDGILNGDVILVKPRDSAPTGSRVAAWIQDSGATVKVYDAAEDALFTPDQSDRWTHYMRPQDRILGVVVGVVRVFKGKK